MSASPQYDVIVIGAGAAGIPAALFASEAGAKTLLIEAAEDIGGTFHLSSGQMSASATRIQADKGIADTPALHFDDVMRINGRTANPDLVRLAVEHAADTLHWLLDSGLVLEPHHPVIHQGHLPYETPRTYWAPEGGMAILKRLRPLVEDAVASGRLDLRTGTRLKALITDDSGAVTGITVIDNAGALHRIAAKDVILATGGYTANSELFSELSMGKPLYGGGYAFCRGDGFLAATAIGADRRGTDQFLPAFAGVKEPSAPGGYTTSTETYPQYRQPWEVYVDLDGRRFVREDEPNVDTRERALLNLPEMRFWAIYDSAILREAPPFIVNATPEEAAARFGNNDAYVRADSLVELAQATGMNPLVLQQTVDHFNAGVRAGTADPMGREHWPLPIAEGPFYAIEHVGWSIVGFAGLSIDTNMRVIATDGAPIPGLYAAGEVIGLGQTSGGSFCGGMSVTPAMTFGRLVGIERGQFHGA